MTIIVGAGMAGLLAGNMLRHHNPKIYEAQTSLPNNHSAVLRFKTPAVGDVLGVPFKKVTMIKGHEPWRNPIADALAYSSKVTGVARSDRSIIAGTTVGERYIAPPDLIGRMAASLGASIEFNSTFSNFETSEGEGRPVISTLPMPVLMKALNYPHGNLADFRWSPGVNVRAEIDNCDAYVSLYFPDPELDFSRVSITGNELIVEMPFLREVTDEDMVWLATNAPSIASRALLRLGLSKTQIKPGSAKATRQRYAKVLPVPDDVRKDFMHWATDQHNVYSLGRFATWRPGLLMDDLVQDIRLIDKWISRRDRYSIARHR